MNDSINWQAIAKLAYESYFLVVQGKNYQGLPMPSFDDLPKEIQQAWAAAVRRAAQEVALLK